MIAPSNIAAVSVGLAPPAGIDPWSIAVSVLLFATVVVLVMAVFSQGGKIEISPQREAALATGHTDRKTAFESTYLRPMLWLLLALSHRLAIPRSKHWLRRKLVAAGSPNYYTAEEYLALAFMTGLTVIVVLEVFHFLLLDRLSWALLPIGLVVGAFLRLYQIHEKASKRLRTISKRLPYSLDLIALAMGAGATFTEAVKAVVRESGDDPMNVELKTVLAEIELGTTRKRALQNLAARVPLEMLQSIVASVVQAEELGTPLADVLHSEATLLRLQRSVRAENAAAVASVRILVPGTLIVMAVVLAVFAPFIIRAVSQGGLF